MDANDVIENLWYEAETIRRAVAEAYSAVGGPTPLPSSLTQILAYIAANAGGGEVPAGSTVVTNASLTGLANALMGGAEGQTGQALIDNVLQPSVTQIASLAEQHSAVNPAAAWNENTDALTRVAYITSGLRTMQGDITIEMDGMGEYTINLASQYYSASAAQFKNWLENSGDADITTLKDALEVSIDKPIDDWTLGEFIPFVMLFFGLGMESPTTWPPQSEE